MVKLYVIERRTVMAQDTHVAWLRAWGLPSLWDPDRAQARAFSFADAVEYVRRLDDAARAFGDYHVHYKRHEVVRTITGLKNPRPQNHDRRLRTCQTCERVTEQICSYVDASRYNWLCLVCQAPHLKPTLIKEAE